MDHHLNPHVALEIMFNRVDNIVAHHDILRRRDLTVHRRKAAARPVIMHHQIVQADDPIIRQNLFINIIHQLFIRGHAQQRIRRFFYQIDPCNDNQHRHHNAHITIQVEACQLCDHRAQQDG